jgi:outer membrane protein TolC
MKAKMRAKTKALLRSVNGYYVCVAALLVGAVGALAQQSTPPAEGGPSSHRAPATSLQLLLDEAERNNPEILAAGHGWKAAKTAVPAASALPDTGLSVQSFSVGSPRPGAGFDHSDFAYIGFGASQEFPYPGKRALRGQVAEREADAAREQADAVRRQITGRLKAAYFQLAYLQQMLGVLERNDQALSDVEKIAESRYRVGQGNQQDVLKAQLQHTRILEQTMMHHRDEGQLQAELKQLLGRPQPSPDVVAEPISVRALTLTATDLQAAVEQHNPDVLARAAMLNKADTQINLAKKEFLPDFNVQYMFERTGSSFPAYYVATFGINLPNRGRRKAELAKANEQREQANADLAAETQRQMAEVQSQYIVATTSAEQLKIYKEGLLPQSDATFRSALAAYQSNRQDFETLLSSFLDLLNLDLDYQRELATHEAALARIETLTGVTLP